MEKRLLDCEEIILTKPLIQALADYHNAIPNGGDEVYPLIPLDEGVAFMRKCLKENTGKTMGVFEKESLIGFASIHFEKHHGWLDYLFIYEQYRGNGLGKALMDWAMTEFNAADAEMAHLKVVEGNVTKNLYKKYGFKVRSETMSLDLKKEMPSDAVKKTDFAQEKMKTAKDILEALPQWFGIPEAVEQYICESAEMPFFIANDGEKAVGFLAVKEASRYASEIYVMGVLPEYHRKGFGRRLVMECIEYCRKKGYEFLQVKTLAPSHTDEGYEKTRKFYSSMGFKPLEENNIWGNDNPCLVMIRGI